MAFLNNFRLLFSSLRPLADKEVAAARDKGAAKRLVRALKDHDELVRDHAVEALGRIRCVDALGPIIHTLANDRSDFVRRTAARVLV